jgi:DNA-binding Lrp family transcriptional regulator
VASVLDRLRRGDATINTLSSELRLSAEITREIVRELFDTKTIFKVGFESNSVVYSVLDPGSFDISSPRARLFYALGREPLPFHHVCKTMKITAKFLTDLLDEINSPTTLVFTEHARISSGPLPTKFLLLDKHRGQTLQAPSIRFRRPTDKMLVQSVRKIPWRGPIPSAEPFQEMVSFLSKPPRHSPNVTPPTPDTHHDY